MKRPAYTLLEVILALALTTVVLGLIGMSIRVHLGVADKSRVQVEEAQLARGLLQRIADDLRNAVPYSAASEASASSTSSNTSETNALSSDDATTNTTDTSLLGGVYGDARRLQMDTSRRPRPIRLPAAYEAADASLAIPLSDVKTVVYSLGEPDAAAASEGTAGSPPTASGLYRRELERANYVCAVQQGQTELLGQATDLLAPEVVDLRFTYYDGTTYYDSWNTTEQGKLPVAVKAAIRIRRPRVNVLSGAEDDAAPAVYDILIELPNATVQSSAEASSGSSASEASGSQAGMGGGA